MTSAESEPLPVPEYMEVSALVGFTLPDKLKVNAVTPVDCCRYEQGKV